MKKNFKQVLALLFAAVMAISCMSAVSAETNTTVFLSSEGLALPQASNGSVYTEEAYGLVGTAWSQMNATSGDISKGIYKDKEVNAAYLGFAPSAPLYAATITENRAEELAAAGISPISEERYFVIPLHKTGNTNIGKNYSVKFSDKIDDFANATVQIDLAKGSSYKNYNQNKIVGYKFGLGFVDFEKQSLSYTAINKTRENVYPADFAWLDIAKSTIDGLPTYSSSLTFDASKYTVSFPVSEILENGTHKKINGATVDVTAENANAVVIGVILNDATYYCGGSLLFFNNLQVLTEDNTDPNEPVITDNRTKADLLLWSRSGAQNSTSNNAGTYSAKNVWAYNIWNVMASLGGGNSAQIFTQQDCLANLTLGRMPIASATAWDGASPIDKERYRILPLANSGALNPNQNNFKYYNDGIINFENGVLKVDMIKGGGFPDISKGDDNQYKAFKIGLAYVDYFSPAYYTSGSTREVFATDIAWLDITEQIEALNEFPAVHSVVDWNDVKKEISVPISDIIENGTHKYINGASATTHTLTADNANAVVFGIELEKNVYPSGIMLYFDNLRVSMPVPATSVSFDEASSINNGVTLKIANGESDDITPTVLAAYYLDDTLVDVKINTSFTAEAGYLGEKSAKYPIDESIEFDKLVFMALDGTKTLKPLCPKFEEILGNE